MALFFLFLAIILPSMDLNFSYIIVKWYASHHRELPWRGISDPYRIWVSEIILQQTRIAQGRDYYLRFINRFPSVQTLANASEDEVLLLWQGLGYYSRARNMHKAAKKIVAEWGGVFPNSYDGIRSLNGVGDYTAAAIASFAFHLPHAVLDGNVFRVLSRFFAIDIPIDTATGKKHFQNLAQELLDEKHPEMFNQGLMDLGATICLPSSPNCADCPLADGCLALAQNKTTDFPVKAKKTQSRKRYLVYLAATDGKDTFLHKRGQGDIWTGLYEFPLVELDEPFDENIHWGRITAELSANFTDLQVTKIHPPLKHMLTHQTLFAWFIEGTAICRPDSEKYIRIPKSDIGNYAISRLTERFLEKQK